MRKSLTAAEAKTHFAESLRLAEAGEVVEITRYGRPVAAIVGARQLEELERLRTSRPRQGLAALVGRWDDGEELAEEVDRVVAGRGPALRYQLTLVTANVRHFDRVPDLRILAFEPGESGRFEPP